MCLWWFVFISDSHLTRYHLLNLGTFVLSIPAMLLLGWTLWLSGVNMVAKYELFSYIYFQWLIRKHAYVCLREQYICLKPKYTPCTYRESWITADFLCNLVNIKWIMFGKGYPILPHALAEPSCVSNVGAVDRQHQTTMSWHKLVSPVSVWPTLPVHSSLRIVLCWHCSSSVQCLYLEFSYHFR